MPNRSLRSLISLGFLFSLSLLTAVAAKEQSKTPTQAENSLKTFFSELIRKPTVVGGTVLRGEAAKGQTGAFATKIPLFLQDQDVFKVLPGSAKVSLSWDSKPYQRWYLKIDQQTLLVEGGTTEIELHLTSSSSVHTWELRSVDKSSFELSGSWFFLQGIETSEAQALTSLLANNRTLGLDQTDTYREVCLWMHKERLVNFNQWCVGA